MLTICLSRPAPPQSSRHSKLEKADILEMTVKHLRNLQRAQMTGKKPLALTRPTRALRVRKAKMFRLIQEIPLRSQQHGHMT